MGEMIAVAQMYTVRQHCTTASDTAETCRKLKDAGFSAFLIGTAFMDSEDPGESLKDLLEKIDKEQ